jgi:hypothetical protein
MDSFHLVQHLAGHQAQLAAGKNKMMGEKWESIAGAAD